MDENRARDAARLLWDAWQRKARIDGLPAACRPASRAEGYAIQAELARLTGFATAGWKIAATSVAGQRHINVDGPLAGRLFDGRRLDAALPVPLDGNQMRVAEAEFAFRMAQPLPPRAQPYTNDEVLRAAGSLHPAIEIPDSRYADFVTAGAPQLIADDACACWFVVGTAVAQPWRAHDFAAHRVTGLRNGAVAAEGSGANVLGNPVAALAWVASEVARFGPGLAAGDVVITGTAVPPFAIDAGDRVAVDFGDFGRLEVRIAG